jgi:acetyl-CoA carboxylase biotin carboxyl carrier protein
LVFNPTRGRGGLFEGIDMTTQTIRSEITGTVWTIVVQAGDVLEADDTIMILESMKMEIPVVAPETGRVVELLVAEGAPVREGQEVAVFEDAQAP